MKILVKPQTILLNIKKLSTMRRLTIILLLTISSQAIAQNPVPELLAYVKTKKVPKEIRDKVSEMFPDYKTINAWLLTSIYKTESGYSANILDANDRDHFITFAYAEDGSLYVDNHILNIEMSHFEENWDALLDALNYGYQSSSQKFFSPSFEYWIFSWSYDTPEIDRFPIENVKEFYKQYKMYVYAESDSIDIWYYGRSDENPHYKPSIVALTINDYSNISNLVSDHYPIHRKAYEQAIDYCKKNNYYALGFSAVIAERAGGWEYMHVILKNKEGKLFQIDVNWHEGETPDYSIIVKDLDIENDLYLYDHHYYPLWQFPEQ